MASALSPPASDSARAAPPAATSSPTRKADKPRAQTATTSIYERR